MSDVEVWAVVYNTVCTSPCWMLNPTRQNEHEPGRWATGSSGQHARFKDPIHFVIGADQIFFSREKAVPCVGCTRRIVDNGSSSERRSDVIVSPSRSVHPKRWSFEILHHSQPQESPRIRVRQSEVLLQQPRHLRPSRTARQSRDPRSPQSRQSP